VELVAEVKVVAVDQATQALQELQTQAVVAEVALQAA
jgi:hypothetical protein